MLHHAEPSRRPERISAAVPKQRFSRQVAPYCRQSEDDQEILFGTSGKPGVTAYLPNSENGLTLFTTRHRELAVALADTGVIEIQEMDNEEAETFLRNIDSKRATPRPDSYHKLIEQANVFAASYRISSGIP